MGAGLEDRSWAHQESPWERVEPSQEKVALRPSPQILGLPVLELGHLWAVQLQRPIRSLRCITWLSLTFDTLSSASEMLALELVPACPPFISQECPFFKAMRPQHTSGAMMLSFSFYNESFRPNISKSARMGPPKVHEMGSG